MNRLVTGSRRLGSSINHHGKENFSFEIIAMARTQDDAHETEKFLIKIENTKSPNGYNLTDGGEGSTGTIATPEMRAATSARFKGRRHTEETKRKMSASAMGVKKSPESVAKMAASLTGRKASDEVKAILASYRHLAWTPDALEKLSKALKGRAIPWHWKGAMAQRGRTFSDEHKQKLSAAKRGRSQTPEQVIKRVASRRMTIAYKETMKRQFLMMIA